MKLKLKAFFIVCGVMAGYAFAQSSLPQWNGYIQTRLSSDLDTTEFTIRRAKLWVYGNVPQADYISYKIQAVYRSFKDETPVIQDAYADIIMKCSGKIRAGRFVPDFMLQRMQPDYEIPVLERAIVVNSLIHNEKQMARETGLQYLFQPDFLPAHFSLGVFNANVDKAAHNKDDALLYASRMTYKIISQGNVWLDLGGSAAFRRLDGTSLTTIYKPDTLISGKDFRWGAEAHLHWGDLEIQSEYVQAKINSDIANGWYALADYTFLTKYQAVVLADKYTGLNPAVNYNTWYGVGLNRQVTEKTKIMTDIKTRKSGDKLNSLGEIQLQVFFN